MTRAQLAEKRSSAVAEIAKGKTIAEVATETGYSPEYLVLLCRRMGVQIRR